MKTYQIVIIATLSFIAFIYAANIGLTKQYNYQLQQQEAKVDCVYDQAIENAYEIAYVCEVPVEYVKELQED